MYFGYHALFIHTLRNQLFHKSAFMVIVGHLVEVVKSPVLETRGLGFELCLHGWGGDRVAVRLHNIYIYLYSYIFIYTYIERERERESFSSEDIFTLLK